MARATFFPLGTRIVPIRDVGPVRKGQPGIVTDIVNMPSFLWWRRKYVCIFAGNVSSVIEPVQLEARDHGYTVEQLQAPGHLMSPIG